MPNDYYLNPSQNGEWREIPSGTNAGLPYMWGLQMIEAEEAWKNNPELLAPDPTDSDEYHKPVVAVLGSGIDIEHPDLVNNLYQNPGEISGDGIDNDEDGYVDNVHGWNTDEDTNDVMDVDEHETAVAGIIVAECNNIIGPCGIGSNKVLVAPIKIGADSASVTTTKIARGILYAAEIMKADVIALAYSLNSALFHDIIKRVKIANSLLVVSTGNNGHDFNNNDWSDYNEVLSVSAVQSDRQPWPDANFGEKVKISAPGENIVTTVLTEGSSNPYRYFTGTSAAMPFVAGVAGLLKWKYKNIYGIDLSYQDLSSLLVNSTSAFAIDTDQYGNGILDINNALLKSESKIAINLGSTVIGVEKIHNFR